MITYGLANVKFLVSNSALVDTCKEKLNAFLLPTLKSAKRSTFCPRTPYNRKGRNSYPVTGPVVAQKRVEVIPLLFPT
jgi:hypothetical protein